MAGGSGGAHGPDYIVTIGAGGSGAGGNGTRERSAVAEWFIKTTAFGVVTLALAYLLGSPDFYRSMPIEYTMASSAIIGYALGAWRLH